MEELQQIIEAFAVKLAEDLNASMVRALGPRPNPPSVSLYSRLVWSSEGVTIQILSTEDYWYYIENGRKAGKMPPPDKFGKKWQNKLGIDARKIIYEMQVKTRKSGLKKNKKALNYDKAAKSLAFLIARSIGKKGVKPKPFIDSVVKDGRIQELTQTIAKILSKEIIVK